MKIRIKLITYGAMIAAMYTALTLAFAPVSFGAVQFRISESLCVLPFFTPAAIFGLFAGCLVANIFGGNGIYDIVLGSLSTLFAAYLTYRIKNRILALIPPVLINALVIGTMLGFLYSLDITASILSVGFGQLIVLYGPGLLLLYIIYPVKNRLFRGVLSKYRL